MATLSPPPEDGFDKRPAFTPVAKSVWPLAVVLLVGLGVTAVAYRTAHRAEERRVEHMLDFRTEWRATSLAKRLDDAQVPVLATAVYVKSSPALTPADFARFISSTNISRRSIAALSWAPRVTNAERASFEAAQRRAGLDNFEILERNADGVLVRAAERDEYMPVVMEGRFDGTRSIFGFDVGSVQDTAVRARDTGQVQATVPSIITVRSAISSYLVFWPVYDGIEAPPTLKERRQSFRGVVMGVYRTITVLNDAIADTPAIPERIDVLAAPAAAIPPGPAMTFAVFQPAANQFQAMTPDIPAPMPSYRTTRSFDLGGVRWQFDSSFSPEAVEAERSIGPASILVAGILLTALFTAFIARGRRQLFRVQELVEERTRELSETTKQLRAMFDSAPIAMFYISRKSRKPESWNPIAGQMFGYGEEEIANNVLSRLISMDPAEADSLYERTKNGEIIRNHETRARHKDGSIVLLRLSGAPVIASDGTPLGVVTILEDITEAKRREEQLLRSQTLLAGIISSSDDAIISKSLDGIVTSWNEAAERIFGYTAAEMIGRPIGAIAVPGHEDDMIDVLDKVKRGERVDHYETQRRRKDGTIIDISLTVSPIHDAQGNIVGASKVARDITAAKQAEQREARLEEQLHHAEKMDALGSLTGGVAHDFNNLLTVIKSSAEDLIEELKDNPQGHELAEMSLEAANRGAELVQQLLSFARKQELAPKIVDLSSLLEQFARLLGRTFEANVHVDLKPSSEALFVYVDPRRLENALLNLAINARDAMPTGGTLVIETATRVLDEDYVAENAEVNAGRYVMIALTDSGSGMPPEVVERAFEPFFTTKEVGKGTGLGLSMVYGFIKQSGGHAKIYSEVGRGTTIKIYLPRVTEQKSVQEEVQVKSLTGAHGHILLVEDNDLVQQSVERKLIKFGYTVTSADSAREAIAVLEEKTDIDLVFSDVIMPGEMNGAQLAEEIARRWPKVPVLLTSGYTESTALGKVHMPVGVRLLSKPYSSAELAETLRELLASSAATARSTP